MNPLTIIVKKYGNRNWAIYINDDLLAVTVYKKGANAIKAALTGLHAAANRVPLHPV